MKCIILIVALSMLFPHQVFGQRLPDLGDVSQATITPRQERQIGLQIMRQIRADPSYLDDPEVADYLGRIGARLVAVSDRYALEHSFEFFALNNSEINAFAMPGGFMGFHSGLIIAAQNESELAGVMAHEIAHVTQKHLARMISASKYPGMIASIAALAIAILASRSNPQASSAVMAATQAGMIQSQLNFTRKHEKEADRIGFDMLVKAGFDPHGMASFFERMQQASRYHENSAPSFLRTHPVTFERIADIQNRVREIGYRQVPDSIEFHLVRAKLRALQGSAFQKVSEFEARLQDRRYINETAERYGLIQALLRAKKYERAEKELSVLYQIIQSDPAAQPLKNHRLGEPIRIEGDYVQAAAMIDTLAARVKLENGQVEDAFKLYQTALAAYPHYRALIYGYADALLRHGQPQAALDFIREQLQITRNDIKLHQFEARSHEALGNRLLQHQAQAEALILEGKYKQAAGQLQIALQQKHENFYQLSSVEARLRQLREAIAEYEKDQ